MNRLSSYTRLLVSFRLVKSYWWVHIFTGSLVRTESVELSKRLTQGVYFSVWNLTEVLNLLDTHTASLRSYKGLRGMILTCSSLAIQFEPSGVFGWTFDWFPALLAPHYLPFQI